MYRDRRHWPPLTRKPPIGGSHTLQMHVLSTFEKPFRLHVLGFSYVSYDRLKKRFGRIENPLVEKVVRRENLRPFCSIRCERPFFYSHFDEFSRARFFRCRERIDLKKTHHNVHVSPSLSPRLSNRTGVGVYEATEWEIQNCTNLKKFGCLWLNNRLIKNSNRRNGKEWIYSFPHDRFRLKQ